MNIQRRDQYPAGDVLAALEEEDRQMVYELAARRIESQRLMEIERCRTVRAIERHRAESQVALAEIDFERQIALESHQRDLFALGAVTHLVARSCFERPDCDYHKASIEKREPAWTIFCKRTAWSVSVERRRQL